MHGKLTCRRGWLLAGRVALLPALSSQEWLGGRMSMIAAAAACCNALVCSLLRLKRGGSDNLVHPMQYNRIHWQCWTRRRRIERCLGSHFADSDGWNMGPDSPSLRHCATLHARPSCLTRRKHSSSALPLIAPSPRVRSTTRGTGSFIPQATFSSRRPPPRVFTFFPQKSHHHSDLHPPASASAETVRPFILRPSIHHHDEHGGSTACLPVGLLSSIKESRSSLL